MKILNESANRIIRLLSESGYKAYAVGGCVRDMIIGRTVTDIDITTSAKPDETERVLSENGIKYFETGLKHGTVTAVLNGESFEITTFRTDGSYLDNRHPSEVTFVTDLSEDLSRRDFTINALAFNEDEGVVDLFCGREDIENELIRAVGNPELRFKEDGLRIMRALRFSAVLGFEIEKHTKKAIFKCKNLLLNIAYERLFTELKKLLLGDYAERVLLEYRDILAVIIPELKPTFDFPQNSRWHIYDIYTHSVKSVCVSPKKDYIRLALLFHDIGKPDCRTTDERGVDHFYGHPEVGAKYARDIMNRFKTSNELKEKVVRLVEIHDLHISRRRSNIKKWMRIIGGELILDYIDVKISDMLTHNLELSEPEIEELKYIRMTAIDIINSGEPYRISDLVINGNDLVKTGFSGAQIKEELESLINEVSGNPECNRREWLLSRAERDYKMLNN